MGPGVGNLGYYPNPASPGSYQGTIFGNGGSLTTYPGGGYGPGSGYGNSIAGYAYGNPGYSRPVNGINSGLYDTTAGSYAPQNPSIPSSYGTGVENVPSGPGFGNPGYPTPTTNYGVYGAGIIDYPAQTPAANTYVPPNYSYGIQTAPAQSGAGNPAPAPATPPPSPGAQAPAPSPDSSGGGT